MVSSGSRRNYCDSALEGSNLREIPLFLAIATFSLGIVAGFILGATTGPKSNICALTTHEATMWSIFIKNFLVTVKIISGGVLFGIPVAFILALNGMIAGALIYEGVGPLGTIVISLEAISFIIAGKYGYKIAIGIINVIFSKREIQPLKNLNISAIKRFIIDICIIILLLIISSQIEFYIIH